MRTAASSPMRSLGHNSQSFLSRHVPITGWIRAYNWRKWLKPDIVAGISVAALLIPESMGYAGIAGLPPEVGLYAAPLALLAYAILGRSTVLVVATSSSTAAVSASVIADVNQDGSADSALALSAALALFTGVILVVAGLMRLGWVANFMSKTVIGGFIIGLSISIIIGQLDDLLGIDVTGGNSFAELWSVISQVGSWNPATVIVGVISLALLFGLERFVAKVPAALTVVVLAVLCVQLVAPVGIAVVGDIPQGLPTVGVPDFSNSQISGLITGGLAVALIGFSEGYGAASSFARKYVDRLENNQEFIAFGASNIGAGLTSGMVVGGSLSKTAANDSAKAKSQLSSVVNAVLVVLTLLFLAPFFENLPEATLAAVVIHALWHSASPRKLAPVWRVTRVEFALALVVLLAVLILGTLPAIVLGVIISLGIVVYRVSFPQAAELRRDRETGAFENREVHEDVEQIPGIVVYRFEAPLIYANAGAFASAVNDLVDAAEPPARALVVDCEVMFGIDYTGTEMLEALVEDMRERGIDVRLARVHGPVLRRLRTSGVLSEVGEHAVFARVQDAVATGTPQVPS
jgi:sulfate permease, SulP family